MAVSSLRSALILAYMLSIVWVKRNPLSLVYLFFAPLTLLFLLFVIIGVGIMGYALVGALVMILVQGGTALVGDAAWHRLELKFQDMLIASPISQMTYTLGLSLSELVYSSPALAIVVGLMFWFGLTVQGGVVVAPVLVMTWLSMSSLGFYVSTYMPNIRNAWQISLLLSLFLAILPPVFYPIEHIPIALRWAAYAVPTTHSAILIREAIGLPQPLSWPSLFSWLTLIGYTVLLMGLALHKARWGRA